MSHLKERLGQEVYELLYVHYDADGDLIEDFEDVISLSDDEICQSRILKLEALLTPITDLNSSYVPIEAAKLLAAWGSDKAIEYLDSCVDQRIDRLGNGEPHRLHTSYDETYEKIIEACIQFYTRKADRDFLTSKTYNGELSQNAKKKIYTTISKIITLTQDVTLDMGYLIKIVKRFELREYLPNLKKCYLDFNQRPESDLNRRWNLADLTELLEEWEPEFIRQF